MQHCSACGMPVLDEKEHKKTCMTYRNDVKHQIASTLFLIIFLLIIFLFTVK